MPGSGIEPLVHFPGCHVMGSLRPISISHHPQPKSPAVRYDARRPRSRQFWNALVSGERYYQPISSLFPGHAGRTLRRQPTILRCADCAEPKSLGAAKASSNRCLICLRASVPAYPTRSCSQLRPPLRHRTSSLNSLCPLFRTQLLFWHSLTHLPHYCKDYRSPFDISSSSTVTGSSINQHLTSLILRVT